MNPEDLSQPLRILRVCLHLLIAALLVLVAWRAVTGHQPKATAIVAVTVALVVIYAAGPAYPPVRRSRRAATAWLMVLTAGWLVLLALTPDAVWLAYPLFLLQLHLLRARWGLLAVAVTTLAAISGFAWHQQTLAPAAAIGPVIGAAVAVATVLGYQALYRESEQRRRLVEQLQAARTELAATERSAGVLAERERLAREIHDTLAQGLSSIQLLLRAAQRGLPDQVDVAAVDHIERARQTAQENLAEARRFVRALTPPALDGKSLPTALQRLCTTTDPAAPAVHFHLDGTPVFLPTPYEVALLRIAQSALSNAIRHADANRVKLTLTYMETHVALDIVDDGVGFDPDTTGAPGHTDGGFGLAAIRARVDQLGGTLCIESAPGHGTAMAVSLAYQTDEKAASQT